MDIFSKNTTNSLKQENTFHIPMIGELREVIDPTGLCAWDWPDVCDPYDVVNYFDVIPTGSIVLVTQILEDNKKPIKKTLIKKILERLDLISIPEISYLIMDSRFVTHWVAKDSLNFSTRKL